MTEESAVKESEIKHEIVEENEWIVEENEC